MVSFMDFTYSVADGVATLIFGENLDGTNQDHNGSGKSALIEAISLALTGDYLREVKTTEELINDSAEACMVSAELENDYNNVCFTIKRTIGRKTGQRVECHQYDADGAEINTGMTVQPTVNDYNKFILGEIGLSKEDLYNYFILCRSRYVSFLSAKDKDKKELINRFSGGYKVDMSIEALEADMEPVGAECDRRHEEVVRCQARVDTVDEQIASFETSRQEALKAKADKAERLREKIAEKRQEIRDTESSISRANDRLDLIDGDVSDALEALEKDHDLSLDEAFKAVSELFEKHNLTKPFNVVLQSEEISNGMERDKAELKGVKARLSEFESVFDRESKALQAIVEHHKKLVEETAQERTSLKETRTSLEEHAEKVAAEMADMKRSLDDFREKLHDSEKAVERLKVRLHGVVECPECGHKFFVDAKGTFEEAEEELGFEEAQRRTCERIVNEGEEKMSDMEQQKGKDIADIAGIDSDIRRLDKEIDMHQWAVDRQHEARDRAKTDIDGCKARLSVVETRIKAASERILALRKNMFDNAFDTIDSTITRGEEYVKGLEDKCKLAKESISQYEKFIDDLSKDEGSMTLAGLEKQRETYRRDLDSAQSDFDEKQAELNVLKMQKEHFTAFKTYLANTKIDAISGLINSFLDEIGSDIRVNIDGYRVLKSKKVSEKITVNLLRNGVDGGSFSKYSCGERARVELASVLALQELLNANCEDGRGMDLLVVDEVLDGMDETGIMAAAETLNKLRKTALVITQGQVAENYPYRLVVMKKNGISTLKTI